MIFAGCSPNGEVVTHQPNVNDDPIPTIQITNTFQSDDHYTPTGLFLETNLLVYRDPSMKSPVVGEIPIGSTQIRITEGSLEEENPWVLIDFNQINGWVDYQELALHKGDLPEELIILGYQTLAALKDMDFNQIDELIHPERCLRISPYPYLADNNRSICPGEFRDLMVTDELQMWGNYDGTGEPIQMNPFEYYQTFIYDSDYIQAPVVGLNVEVSSGNSINNIPEIFPDGKMIEYYFPGFDPKYGGMDWRSLRLVFVNVDGSWYLSAIIHGEWTI
jgi:hypothetical protein